MLAGSPPLVSRPMVGPLRAIPFLLLALSLVGCGWNGDAGRAEVSFMIFGDPAELAAYERLVEAFELEHPGIAIALRHVPSQGDYRRRLATEFAAG
ncbi:MAG: hypothetical protein GQ526_07575, partial [Ardenticatenales bacterium]|nr:hypothetical protein [Ardenticatenales bacterium]